MAGLRREEMAPALELIRSLKSEGLAIVAVEHVMKVILEISDEVLVMHEGAELTRGPPEDVVKDDRVIEAYLGRRYAKRAAAERAAAERAAAEGTASTDA
jgi:branched-chain amino acid transport system ATP-binding protein